MGKLCYFEGLPECWKCSPKQAKMQFKDYCLQFFSSHVSAKPALGSLWSTSLHWNPSCQYFSLFEASTLLCPHPTWSSNRFDMIIFSLFHHWSSRPPPTFLWLLLSPGCCVSTSIIDSTFLSSECWGYQHSVHRCPLCSLVEQPHCFKYHPVIIHLHTVHLQWRRHEFNPWVGKIPWRREWQPTPVFLPEESHGQRSLPGYSSWGHLKLDMTKQLIHTHTCIPSPALFPELIHLVQHLKLCSLCALKNLFLPLSSPFQFLSFLIFSCFGK